MESKLMNYIFNFEFEINSIALSNYCKHSPIPIIGEIVEGKHATIITELELTATQETSLRNYIDVFENYTQELLDMATLDKTKAWGRDRINELEISNMNRKRQGLMGRVELKNIMGEVQSTSVMLCFEEGSLDTLHGLLYGFPEEIVGENTIPAEAPLSFFHIWAEDLTWIKTELNTFLASL